MHLSILIPGGKGAGNGWGFYREFYPHRRAFDEDFFPGCRRFVMRFQYKAWSLESRKPEVQKLLLSISGVLEFDTVHSLDSGAKIYDAQTLFVALLLPRSIPWVRLF